LLTSAAGVVTAKGVTGVTSALTEVDVLLGLVQEILDGEALLQSDASLLSEAAPERGLYAAGLRLGGYDLRIFDEDAAEIYYNVANVTVDSYGRIAGVWVDETHLDEAADAPSTKWVLGADYGMLARSSEVGIGSEWYQQALALSAAIVNNQGTAGFTETTGLAADEELYLDQVAGVSINVFGMMPAINQALNRSPWTLQDGTYFAEDAGKFLYVGIDDGAIDFVYVDETSTYDQATIQVGDEVFNLFKYTQQAIVGTTLVERDVLIYQDGSRYSYAEELDASEGLAGTVKDASVTFADVEATATTPAIDEEATIEAIPGYGTKYATDPAFKLEAEAFAANFEGAKTAFNINLLADGTTDSITGFTGNVVVWQDLLVEALRSAALPAASAALAQIVPDLTPDTLGTNIKLADGRYYVTTYPNAKGEQFFGLFIVDGNRVVNAVVDATRLVSGEVTTFTSLGAAENASATATDFYKAIGAQVKTLVEDQFEGTPTTTALYQISNGFEYTVDDLIIEIEEGGVFDEFTAYSSQLRRLYHELAYDGLLGLVEEYAADVEAAFKATFLDNGVAKALVSPVNTLVLSGNSINFTNLLGSSSGTAKFNSNASSTAKFAIELDSTDSRVADFSGDELFAEEDLTSNASTAVTMTLDFDDFERTTSVNLSVQTVVSANQDVVAKLNVAAPKTAPGFYADRGYQAGELQFLNNITIVSGSTIIDLPEYVGLINSGASLSTQQTINATDANAGDGNATYYLNYGTDLETPITALSQVPVGTNVITMKLVYDNNGTALATDDKFLTTTYTVIVVTPAAALEAAVDAALPGLILNNGAYSETSVALPKVPAASIASGLTYTWSVIEGDNVASITSSTLTLTRLYTQEKVVLEVVVGFEGTKVARPAGQNSKQFEFRVLPFAIEDIQERLSDAVENAFQLAPKFYDMSNDRANLQIGEAIAIVGPENGTLVNSLFDERYLLVDSGNTTLVWSATASIASLQNSNIYDASNLVFYHSGTGELRLGRNAFELNGEVEITVTATIELRYVSTNVDADVTDSSSFTFTLFNDKTPSPEFSFVFYSGVGNYIVTTPNLGHSLVEFSGLRGATITAAELVLSSGTNEVSIPLSISTSGVRQIVEFTPPTITSGFDAGAAGAIDYELKLSYSYYDESGKLIEVVADERPVVDGTQQVQSAVTAKKAPVMASGAAEVDTFVLQITNNNAVWRDASDIDSGVITTSGGEMVAFTSGLINGNITKVSDTILLITTSGGNVTGFDDGSGLNILPGAFYMVNENNAPTFEVYSYSGTAAGYNVVNLGSGYVSSGLDNRILITLTNGVYREDVSPTVSDLVLGSGTFNSGLITSLEFVSSTQLLIKLSSGIGASSGLGIALNSGLVVANIDKPSTSGLEDLTLTVSGFFAFDAGDTDDYVTAITTSGSTVNSITASSGSVFINLTSGALFNADVSMSDLEFSGVTISAVANADLRYIDTDTIEIYGFTNVVSGTNYEIRIKDTAIIMGSTEDDRLWGAFISASDND
jgi:hypothetical protein